jgi:hypothetical protein
MMVYATCCKLNAARKAKAAFYRKKGIASSLIRTACSVKLAALFYYLQIFRKTATFAPFRRRLVFCDLKAVQM